MLLVSPTTLREHTVHMIATLRAGEMPMKALIAASGASKSAMYDRVRRAKDLPAVPSRPQGRPPLLTADNLAELAVWRTNNPFKTTPEYVLHIASTYGVSVSASYVALFVSRNRLKKRTMFDGPGHSATHMEAAVVEALRAAKFRILICIYIFTHKDVAATLLDIREKHQGMKITVLCDRTKAKQSGSQMKRLVEGGIDVRVGTSKMNHLELCMIDNKISIDGTANWSKAAFESNSEKMEIIYEDPGALKHRNEFYAIQKGTTRFKPPEYAQANDGELWKLVPSHPVLPFARFPPKASPRHSLVSMWRAHEEAAAASSPAAASAPSSSTTNSSQPSTRAAIDAMWKFDAPSSSAAKAPTAAIRSDHGVIGSSNTSRFLWSRMAPEEEEREEEALPSYLSYLQPAFSSTSSSGSLAAFDEPLRRHSTSSSGAPPNLGNPATTLPFVPASAQQVSGGNASNLAQQQRMYGSSRQHNQQQYYSHHQNASNADHASVQVESKSREFANALQDFIRTQMEQQQQVQQHKQQPPGLVPNGSMSCKCEPLKVRVSELEHQLQTLQVQVTALLNGGMGNTTTSMSDGTIQMHAAVVQPPLPGSSMTQMPMPMGMGQQPPLPPGQLQQQLSPSSSLSQLSTGVGSAMSDRVSTLEGRQSAFQSQLAQISKVLGVPVGKHGKNSQVKTLVQTLREEIDVKIVQATTELETKCVENVKEQLESVVESVTREELQAQLSDIVAASTSGSPPASSSNPSSLSYETVLGALAEEHEASLTKLSTYFEERLVQESKQRVGLESRIQTRFGEQEEWLQQLEGEFGSWHDTSSSVAAQIRVIQSKIAEVEAKWHSDLLKWSKLSSESHTQQHASTLGNSAESSSVSPTNSSSSNSGSKAKHKGNNVPAGASANAALLAQQQQANASGTGTISADTFSRTVHQLQVTFKHFQSEYKTEISELRENLALMETWVKTTRQEGRDLAKNAKGMKQLVEKLVRDTGSAEELLQQYVSTITHQVASVTRQYVSVRIRDNNRLIDATLRARVPAYVANETESFMLVRPEKKELTVEDEREKALASGQAVVFRGDDEEGIRKLLASHSVEPSSTIPAAATSS